MTAMQTLSAQDALFLRAETDTLHMHIASVGLYEGPMPDRAVITAAIGAKVARVPRLRQKVRFVALELGTPAWVDDAAFSLDYHLRVTAVAPPGDEGDLCVLVGRVFSQPLDRDRPLWELWFVDGLMDGRWALIAKIHHCMADGVASTDLLSTLLDDRPDAPPEPAPAEWHPEPEPGAARLLVNALSEGVKDSVAMGRDLAGLAAHPARAATDLLHLARELGAVAHWSPPTSLNGPVGSHRRWALVRGRLQEVKTIGAFHAATVNDVVLAAITAGFRALLIARGEDLADTVVRTLVPVSVRTHTERGQFDNRVSALFPELPVAVADPVERLVAIREQMEARKRAGEADGGTAIMALGELAPSVLLSIGEHRAATAAGQHIVQTVATNVPGAPHTLYLAGRRLQEVFPIVPLGLSVRIGIAIVSYDGALNLGVTGDYDSSRDIDILCDGIAGGLAELAEAAGI